MRLDRCRGQRRPLTLSGSSSFAARCRAWSRRLGTRLMRSCQPLSGMASSDSRSLASVEMSAGVGRLRASPPRGCDSRVVRRACVHSLPRLELVDGRSAAPSRAARLALRARVAKRVGQLVEQRRDGIGIIEELPPIADRARRRARPSAAMGSPSAWRRSRWRSRHSSRASRAAGRQRATARDPGSADRATSRLRGTAGFRRERAARRRDPCRAARAAAAHRQLERRDP